jgi:hypothetical protein
VIHAAATPFRAVRAEVLGGRMPSNALGLFERLDERA